MKPAPFDYVAAGTIEEALDQLSGTGGEVTILAGGQTLMPLLALRMSTPSVLLDINKIGALQGVARGNGGVTVGAMTRQSDILTNDVLAKSLPVLVEATRHVGHHQTRNRGTVGGSVCLGEPAAELPATALALGASIEARSANGTRRIPAEEFYLGPYATVLAPDELVTAIHFPDRPAGSITVFREVTRRPGDFALVGLVGSIALKQEKIAQASLAWFGMGPTPIKARQAETALIGQDIRRVDAKGIAELAVADTDPFEDHHATAEYRCTVGRNVFARAFNEALTVRAA